MVEPSRRPPEIPPPFDLSRIRPIPIAQRKNKVRREEFGSLADVDASIGEFIDSLPRILAADELRHAAQWTAESVARGAPVFVAMGGHVVKVGLAPVVNDLMRRGIVRALVFNGSTAIHDSEIAMIGQTSEHVEVNVADGSFGMAHETAALFAAALERARREGTGLGGALGREIVEQQLPFPGDSMLAEAARLGIPVTVHVGIGTDVIHMHPEIHGDALGAATHHDFLLLAALVTELDHGTWINIGSAVVLPEVFLKAVNMARNVGHSLEGITAINFDMLQHYRTSVNVLRRPVARGISLTGHHEINVPLFRIALLRELKARGLGS
ncbi:MAG: hypothetical protein KDC38_08920 [Planctomycetes bacterium]|nr:hypothetical protein [Planctomycetota bacterium]